MGFYYYSLCHVCKRADVNLASCKKCKMLSYCCREHQESDRPKHEELCAVIAATTRILEFIPENPDQFAKFRILTGVLWRLQIGRDLLPYEHQMWMFPKACVICYSKKVKIVCQSCWSVGYCKKAHQNCDKHHEKFCEKLQLCLEVHKKEEEDRTQWNLVNVNFNEEVQKLPENINEVVRMIALQSKVDHFQEPFYQIKLSELFCSNINIIYALEQSKFLQNRNGKRSKLVIHATASEIYDNCNWSQLLEFLSHWILNLKDVKIFLVNSEIEDQLFQVRPNCSECSKKGFRGTVTCLDGEYFDYVDMLPRPDLIVMFNTNIPPVDSPDQGEIISKLITYRKVPIILTSYMEKNLVKTVENFPSSLIKFYVKPQENVYGSLRPVRNGDIGFDPVVYRNSYIAIIAKK